MKAELVADEPYLELSDDSDEVASITLPEQPKLDPLLKRHMKPITEITQDVNKEKELFHFHFQSKEQMKEYH